MLPVLWNNAPWQEKRKTLDDVFVRHMALDYVVFPAPDPENDDSRAFTVPASEIRRRRREAAHHQQSASVAGQSSSESATQTASHRPRMASSANCMFTVQWSPCGTMLAVCSGDCTIDVLDGFTGHSLYNFKGHEEVCTSIAWLPSPREAPLFYTCSLDKTIRLWRSGTEISRLTHHSDWIRCLSFDATSRYLYSGCVSARVYAYDVANDCVAWKTGTIMCPEAEGNPSYFNTVNSIAHAHHSPFTFATGTRDGRIRIWDSRTLDLTGGVPVHSFVAHAAKLNSVAYSFCDTEVLSAGRDSKARLWDMRSVGREAAVVEYSGHRCQDYSIPASFYAGEKFVLTASEDGRVLIYNQQDGSVASEILAHPNSALLAQGCPDDSHRIVSVSFDHVSVWAPSLESPLTDDGMTNTYVDEVFACGPAAMMSPAEEEFAEHHRTIWESLMRKHGDLILSLFRKHNWTFSNGIEDLFRVGAQSSGDEARDIVQFMCLYAQEVSQVMPALRRR